MRKLVLLTYINRSGSTFLMHRLSAFSEVLACPEAEVLIYEFLINPEMEIMLTDEFKAKLKIILTSDFKLQHWQLDLNEILKQLSYHSKKIDVFLAIITAYQKKVKPNAHIVIFKGSRLINVIPLIQKCTILIDLKMVYLFRDPRAVYISQHTTANPLNNKIMCKNPILFGKYWSWFIKRMNDLNQSSDGFILSYETYCRETSKQEAELLNYLGVEKTFRATDGDLKAHIPEEQMFIHHSLDQSPNPEKIANWKNHLQHKSDHLFIVQRTTHAFHHYYPENLLEIKPSKMLFLKTLSFTIRACLAGIFDKFYYKKYSAY